MKYVVLVLALSACAACDGPKKSVEELMKPETCMECHPKHYEQWSGSMHAYAAEDPVFIAMNKRGQRDTNGELGDFCVKCHAPMALELGLANGANFDTVVLPSEAKGVTCFFCHNVASVEGEHNNPLVLAMDQTMRGGVRNAQENDAHDSKFDLLVAGKTNESKACGACHDLVTPNLGVHLERTFAEWKETVFTINDPDAFLPLTCSNCHMFPSDGVIAEGAGNRKNGFHEHMWPGVDLALTPFPQMEAQEERVREDLLAAIAIISPKPRSSTETYGGICLDPPGDLKIRIDSLNVGHMFPSGAAQDRRVWLQVQVFDASNNVIFESGVVPDGVDPEASGDVNLEGFWDKTFKGDNTPAHFFWEVARVESNLLRPAVTRDENDVAFDHSTTFTYNVGNTIFNTADRIEAQVYIRPLPFEALRELEMSGDLDPSIKSQVKTLPAGPKSVWTRATKGTGLARFTNCNP